ncbi:chaperone protein ClpD, chloroplastic-like [Coffea arabica]|uniref:Chaperone protein ClpD, chloroplastic-like n=1 Tax=Coffea arabica TaxID=13443 RepID=A0ABM4VXZ8_COFAR
MISVSSGKAKSNRSLYIAAGVFEKFTKRPIKAVMFSQREAKALEVEMVYTQHLLLGLIAEDRFSGGFLGSGITIEMGRQIVKSIWHTDIDDKEENGKGNGSGLGPEGAEVSATDVPFSPSTKRVFEAVVKYSRIMGYNYIEPKHIAVGLFTVDDESAGRVLKSALYWSYMDC